MADIREILRESLSLKTPPSSSSLGYERFLEETESVDESVSDQVTAISKMLKILGFGAASKDVNSSNVVKYSKWVLNQAKKEPDKQKRIKELLGKLGMKFDESESIDESSLSVGQWIKQTGSDYVIYGVVTELQKNGAAKAVTFTSYDGATSGKAAVKSMKGWHPSPVTIDKSSVPPKIVSKIMSRAGTIKEDVEEATVNPKRLSSGGSSTYCGKTEDGKAVMVRSTERKTKNAFSVDVDGKTVAKGVGRQEAARVASKYVVSTPWHESSEPIMEPGFVKTPEDEKIWARAKAKAKESNPDDFYALANHIFQKMKKNESVEEAKIKKDAQLSVKVSKQGHLYRPTFFDQSGKKVDVYINFEGRSAEDLMKKVRGFFPNASLKESVNEAAKRCSNCGDPVPDSEMRGSLCRKCNNEKNKPDSIPNKSSKSESVDIEEADSVERTLDLEGHGVIRDKGPELDIGDIIKKAGKRWKVEGSEINRKRAEFTYHLYSIKESIDEVSKNQAQRDLEKALTGPDWIRSGVDVAPVHKAIKASLAAGIKPWDIRTTLQDYLFTMSKSGGLLEATLDEVNVYRDAADAYIRGVIHRTGARVGEEYTLTKGSGQDSFVFSLAKGNAKKAVDALSKEPRFKQMGLSFRAEGNKVHVMGESWEARLAMDLLNEAMEPSYIKQLRQISKSSSGGSVMGVRVDAYTAKSIIEVYDKLNPAHRAKMARMPIPKMAQMAFTIINKVRG